MQNTNTSVAVIAPKNETEVQPSFAAAERKFDIHGDTVALRKGEKYTPADFQVLIEGQDAQAKSATSRNAYALHCAGQVSKETRDEVIKRLKNSLSDSAVNNLVSLAGLIPMALTNGIKVPLTVLKDAVAELKLPTDKTAFATDKKTGKFVKSKMTKAGAALLPLLQSGAVTLAKIREIRASDKKPATATPTPSTGTGGKLTLTEAESAASSVLTYLGLAVGRLEKAEFNGSERQTALNHITALARKFGMVVGSDVKPAIPKVDAATVAAAQVK